MPTVLIRVLEVTRRSQTVAVHYPSAADPMDATTQEAAIHAAKKADYWVDSEDDTYSCELVVSQFAPRTPTEAADVFPKGAPTEGI